MAASIQLVMPMKTIKIATLSLKMSAIDPD
jgi:hypothetical protein